MEPFYIRQTAERMTPDDQRAWFQKCADEAKSEGGRHARFSVSHDGQLSLVEAWKERRVPEEGKPRWQISAV